MTAYGENRVEPHRVRRCCDRRWSVLVREGRRTGRTPTKAHQTKISIDGTINRFARVEADRSYFAAALSLS
jgi:hypothetical protein